MEKTAVAMLNHPFFQVSLPIMVTILGTVWALISTNNRRLDDLSKRLDEISARISRIEDRLVSIETRLASVERKVDALELKAWR
jgi:chromosome segregation ATPase